MDQREAAGTAGLRLGAIVDRRCEQHIEMRFDRSI
jgi:hypothetical protein